MICDEIIKRKKELNTDIMYRVFGNETADEIIRNYDFKGSTIPFEKLPDGRDSMLFNELLKVTDLDTAVYKAAEARTTEFLMKYGNWVADPKLFVGETYETGEPTVETLMNIDKYSIETKKEGVEEEALKELRKKIYSKSNQALLDVPNEVVSDGLDTFIGLANKGIRNGSINKAFLYEGVRHSFIKKRDAMQELLDSKDHPEETRKNIQKKIDNMNLLINNEEAFKKLTELANDKLNKMGYKEVDAGANSDLKDKTGENQVIKEAWDSDTRWSIPIKDTLQFSLKTFLHGIKVPKLERGKLTGNYELNEIGFTKTLGSEDLFIKLVSYFNDSNVNADVLMDKLKDSNVPEFVELHKTIDENVYNRHRILNALASSLNKAKNSKMNVLKRNLEYVVYNSNGNVDRKYILNDWRANQSSLAFKNNIFTYDELGQVKLTAHGEGALRSMRFNINQVLTADNLSMYILSDTKDKLLKIIDDGLGSNSPMEVIAKKLEDYMNSKYMPTSINKKPLPNLVKSALGRIFEFDKNITYRIPDIVEAKNIIKVLKINSNDADSPYVSKMNRIELALPMIKEYLDSMGMDFKEKTLRKFLTNPEVYMGEILDTEIKGTVELNELVKAGNSGFNVLYGISNDAIMAKKEGNRNPLATRAAVKVFSKLKEMEEVESIVTSFVNGEGKQESTYSYTNGLDVIVKTARDGDLDFMTVDPFSRHSSLLNKTRNGHELDESTEVVFIDTLTSEGTGKRVIKQNSSDLDKIIMRMNLFVNNNLTKVKTSIFESLVFSDKSRRVGLKRKRIQLDGENSSIYSTFNQEAILGSKSKKKPFIVKVKLRGEPLERLKSIIRAEAERNNDIRSMTAEEAKGYSEAYLEGGKQFLLFPELNDRPVLKKYTDENGIINVEEMLKDKALENYLFDNIRSRANAFLTEANELGVLKRSGALGEVDYKYATDANVQKLEKNKDGTMQVSKEKLAMFEEDLHKTLGMATELIVNETVNAYDMMALIRDPAHNFVKGEDAVDTSKKTLANYYKRLGSDFGARIKGNPLFETKYGKIKRLVNHNKIKYLIANDLEYKEDVANYKELIGKELGSTVVTDGFEFTTLREHIINLYSYGKMDDKIFNSIHSKIIESYKGRGKVVLTDLEKKAIIPQKPIYSGNTVVNGRRHSLIVKSSSVPLLEEYTAGNELDRLREKMEKIEAEELLNEDKTLKEFTSASGVRLAFKSAVKVGAPDTHDIFTDEHIFIEDNFDKLPIVEADRANFGIQQEESVNEKVKVNTVSQMDKLIHNYTFDIKDFEYKGKKNGRQMREIKDNLKKEWIDKKYDTLIKDLGIKGGNLINAEKFANKVYNIAKDGRVSAEELKSLQFENGDFKIPLMLSKAYNSIVTNMLSEIGKGVLRPKISGRGSVQVSNVGMLFNDVSKSGIVFTDNFKNRLEYTKYKNGELKTAQILISREYLEEKGVDVEDITKEVDGVKVIDTKKIDPELLKSVGARIPNQNHSSMIQLEIAGFLPKGYKEMVVVPDQITRQMGSDYDIDHLYKYLYNYKVELTGDREEITDLDTFNKEVGKEMNKKEYVEGVGVIRKKDRKGFSKELLKKGVARKMRLYYDTKKGKLFTRKDVKLKKITADNTKNRNIAVIENEYIDVHHAILSHPDIAKRVISPLDLEDAKIITNKIKKLKASQEDNAYFTPLDHSFIQEEYKSNQGGKDGISIQSSVSMLFPFLQGKSYKVNLTKNETVPVFEINGERLKLNKMGIGTYMFNGEERTNIDSNTVSQNESVDNAKNKRLSLLGYSRATAPIFNGLNFLMTEGGKSLPLETMALFLNHPRLVAEMKNLSNRTSVIHSEDYINASKVLKTASDRIQGNGRMLTDELLSKAIEGTLDEEVSKAVEKTVLDMAATAHSLGSNFMSIYSSINLETGGIGTSIGDFINKKKKIEKYVLSNKRVPDISELLKSKSISKEFTNQFDTFLGRAYHIGMVEAKQILNVRINDKSVTHLGSRVFNSVIENFGYKASSEKNIKRIEKGFLTYNYNNADLPLFKDVNGKQASLGDIRRKLLVGKDNLFNRINEYLSDVRNTEGVDLLSGITIIPLKHVDSPISLRIKSVDKESNEVNKKIRSFVELLTSTNTTARELGNDLLRYVLADSNQYSPTSLNIYTPYDYLIETGMIEGYRDRGFDDNNPLHIIEQVIQHNPTLASDISTIKEAGFKVSTASTNDTFFLTKDVLNNEKLKIDINSIDPYIMKKKGKQMLLYKFRQFVDGGLLYTQISKLGNSRGTFNEFDPFATEAVSVDESNRPKGDLEKELKAKGLDGVVDNIANVHSAESEMLEFKAELSSSDVVKTHFNIKEEMAAGEIVNSMEGADVETIDYITSMTGNSGLKLTVDNTIQHKGKIGKDLIIRINPERFHSSKYDKEGLTKEAKDVIMHEMLHGATFNEALLYDNKQLEEGAVRDSFDKLNSYLIRVQDAILNNPDYAEDFKAFYDKVANGKRKREIEGDAKRVEEDNTITEAEKDKYYGLVSVPEFIAEISNNNFLSFLGNFDVYGNNISFSLSSRMQNLYESIIESKGLGDNEVAKNIVGLVLENMETVLNERVKLNDGVVEPEKPNVKMGNKEYIYNEVDDRVKSTNNLPISEVEQNKVRVKYFMENKGLSKITFNDGTQAAILPMNNGDRLVYLSEGLVGKEVTDKLKIEQYHQKLSSDSRRIKVPIPANADVRVQSKLNYVNKHANKFIGFKEKGEFKLAEDNPKSSNVGKYSVKDVVYVRLDKTGEDSLNRTIEEVQLAMKNGVREIIMPVEETAILNQKALIESMHLWNEDNNNKYRVEEGVSYGRWVLDSTGTGYSPGYKSPIVEKVEQIKDKEDLESFHSIKTEDKELFKREALSANRLFDKGIKDREVVTGTPDVEKGLAIIDKIKDNSKYSLLPSTSYLGKKLFSIHDAELDKRSILNITDKPISNTKELLERIATDETLATTPLERKIAKEFAVHEEVDNISTYLLGDREFNSYYDKEDLQAGALINGFYMDGTVFTKYSTTYDYLLHEIGHHYTLNKLDTDKNFRAYMENLKEMYKETLKDVYEVANIEDVKEFATLIMTNPKLTAMMEVERQFMNKEDANFGMLGNPKDVSKFNVSEGTLEMLKNIIDMTKEPRQISEADMNIKLYEANGGKFSDLNSVDKYTVELGFNPGEKLKAVESIKLKFPLYDVETFEREAIKRYC